MTNLNTLVGFGAGGSGGGGSSSLPTFMGSQISSLSLNNSRGYNGRQSSSSYSGFGAAASADLSNNRSKRTFYFWTIWYDNARSETGMTFNSFQINRSTGAVTQSSYGAQDTWVNTSGAAISTTYLTYDPTYGTYFSGGNNAYPGYGSHVMGYSAGYVQDDGYASGYANYTNKDHAYNGTRCGCLSFGSGNTNYYLVGGYDAGSGYYAGGRVIAASSVSNPSIGGWSADGSWTSSTNAFGHAYQPDKNDGYSNGTTMSMFATSGNSPDYKIAYVSDGTMGSRDISPERYDGTWGGEVFGHTNGYNFFVRSNGDHKYYQAAGYEFSAKDGYPDFESAYSVGSYPAYTHGVGDDCYIYTGDASGSNAHLTFFQVDSNLQPTKIADFGLSTGNYNFSPSGTAAWFFVWENDSDTHPKWAIKCYNGIDRDMGARIESYEITADFTALKA